MINSKKQNLGPLWKRFIKSWCWGLKSKKSFIKQNLTYANKRNRSLYSRFLAYPHVVSVLVGCCSRLICDFCWCFILTVLQLMLSSTISEFQWWWCRSKPTEFEPTLGTAIPNIKRGFLVRMRRTVGESKMNSCSLEIFFREIVVELG